MQLTITNKIFQKLLLHVKAGAIITIRISILQKFLQPYILYVDILHMISLFMLVSWIVYIQIQISCTLPFKLRQDP